LPELINLVCDVTSTDKNVILSKTRKREAVLVRQFIMYFASTKLDVSLASIGNHLGGRDHSTVIHGRDTIQDLYDTKDVSVVKFYDEIKKRIITDPDYCTETMRELAEKRLDKIISEYNDMDGTHQEKIKHLALLL